MAIASIRGMAQSFIRSAVSAGIKSQATWDALAPQFRATYGQFYRRTDFLADYRTWAGVEILRPALQAVRLDYKPSKGLFSETMPYLTRRFKYDVDVTVRIKGREFTMTTSVSTNDWLTPGAMRNSAVEAIKSGVEPESEPEILKAVQTAAYHRPEELWD